MFVDGIDNEKDMEEVKEDTEEIIEEKEDSSSEENNEKVTIIEEDDTDEELNALKDQFIRLQADFLNYRRRTEEEKKEYVFLGVQKIASELLPVVDNLERAMENYEDKECNFYQGIEMIRNQFIDLLKNNGIVEIDSINEKFDPNFHHAVLIEKLEGVEPGIVIDTLQKGYLIKDKVLRPAMVKVSE